MKKAIYMVICVILNIVAIIVFKEHLQISEMSSLSVTFMLLLGFMAWSFGIAKRGEMPLNAGNSTDLSNEEIAKLGEVLRTVSLGMIPFMIPFVFFFNDKIKVIVPAVMLCSMVIVGLFAFRIIYGKKIKARLEKEEKERIEQEKREH